MHYHNSVGRQSRAWTALPSSKHPSCVSRYRPPHMQDLQFTKWLCCHPARHPSSRRPPHSGSYEPLRWLNRSRAQGCLARMKIGAENANVSPYRCRPQSLSSRGGTAESHAHFRPSPSRPSSQASLTSLINLAGTPTCVPGCVMSRMTTAPAPIMQSPQTDTLLLTMAPVPTRAPAPTTNEPATRAPSATCDVRIAADAAVAIDACAGVHNVSFAQHGIGVHDGTRHDNCART